MTIIYSPCSHRPANYHYNRTTLKRCTKIEIFRYRLAGLSSLARDVRLLSKIRQELANLCVENSQMSQAQLAQRYNGRHCRQQDTLVLLPGSCHLCCCCCPCLMRCSAWLSQCHVTVIALSLNDVKGCKRNLDDENRARDQKLFSFSFTYLLLSFLLTYQRVCVLQCCCYWQSSNSRQYIRRKNTDLDLGRFWSPFP